MPFDIAIHGFTQISRVLSAPVQTEIIEKLGAVSGAGRRGMLAHPEVSRLARSDALP